MSLRILLPLLIFAGTLSAQITQVINGASYGPELTAGSWAAVKGTFAGLSATGVINPASPITTSFGGATVKIGTIQAPVWYVSNVQINFLLPASLAPGQYPIEVSNGTTTFASTIRLLPAAPGLFQKDTDTPPRGAVRDSNFVENDAAHLVQRGAFIQIYGSGPGQFQNAVVDGAAVAAVNRTVSTPDLYIGGIPVPAADIQYSGLAGGAAGLWQINAKVPTQAFITGRTPVIVYMDGVASNEVTIFVQ